MILYNFDSRIRDINTKWADYKLISDVHTKIGVHTLSQDICVKV